MADPDDEPTVGSAHDPLPEALGLAQAAAEAGLGLKLLGGLAVRVLCPDFPPRLRRDQDMDFACLAKGRKEVAAWLADQGCVPDRRFNNLNGDRQMYFNAPSGRPIDVMVDRLTMCHTLDFRPAVRAAAAHRGLRGRAAVQAADRRAEREGRAGHRRTCWPGSRSATAPRPRSTPGGSARCWPRTGAGGGRSPGTWPSCPPCWPRSPGSLPPGPAVRPAGPGAATPGRRGADPEGGQVEAPGQRGRPGPLVRASRGSGPLAAGFPGMRPKFTSSCLDAGFGMVLDVAQDARALRTAPVNVACREPGRRGVT